MSNQALVPTEHRVVDIQGGELEGCAVDGVWYVAMPRACRRLRLDWSAQYRRLLRDPILREGIAMMAIPSVGGAQETLCLKIDLFWGWLFKLDLARLEPDVQEQIMPIQRAGYQALYERFSGSRDSYHGNTLPAELRDLVAAEVARQLAAHNQPASASQSLFEPLGNVPADSVSKGALLLAGKLREYPPKAQPTRQQMAAFFGVELRTIDRWLQQLRQANILIPWRRGRRVLYQFSKLPEKGELN